MSYEILGHSADEKFRAEGQDLEEAFSEAVKAFSDIVGGEEGEKETYEIKLEAGNLEALLFDFLARMIFLQDTEEVTVARSKELSIEDSDNIYRLEAVLEASRIQDGTGLDIKAPTYNEMKIREEEGNWVIEAVLDV